jgi:hypothetical protein
VIGGHPVGGDGVKPDTRASRLRLVIAVAGGVVVALAAACGSDHFGGVCPVPSVEVGKECVLYPDGSADAADGDGGPDAADADGG